MTYTALEVATWARDAIGALKPMYRSDSQLFDKLAEMSGLSKNHIATFARDPDYNITYQRLDKLVAAVKILSNSTHLVSQQQEEGGRA